jgi:hypothetical protein
MQPFVCNFSDILLKETFDVFHATNSTTKINEKGGVGDCSATTEQHQLEPGDDKVKATN